MEPEQADDRPLIEPQGGPGLRPTGRADPAALTAVIFAALCLVPTAWFGRGIGAEAFGPIVFPALLAILAVLFGFITLFRGMDKQAPFLQRIGLGAAAVGLFRLFIYPMAGW